MKMFEKELMLRSGEPCTPDGIPRGGIDRALPAGDLDESTPEEEGTAMRQIGITANKPGSSEPGRLTCDACGRAFDCLIDPADKPSEFDPATAAALCDLCGDEMVRLMGERAEKPFAYAKFRNRVAESVARKLGVIPVGN